MSQIPITLDDIDAILPQTQCRECGYQGCRPYAEAILTQAETLDKCPPGGIATLKQLGQLLNRDVSAELTAFTPRAPSVARIIEEDCIGCTKCIQACPVDAIIGSAKWMHSIITSECTGCGLCIPPCPVDCIVIDALPKPAFDPDIARNRYQQRNARLARIQQKKQLQCAPKPKTTATATEEERKRKQEYIKEAIKRVEQKRPTP